MKFLFFIFLLFGFFLFVDTKPPCDGTKNLKEESVVMRLYASRLRGFIRNCYKFPTSHDDIVNIMQKKNKRCNINEVKDGNLKIVLADKILGDLSGALFYEIKDKEVFLSYIS